MKTVSLKLPDALANWLEKQAAAERRSKSRIVGEILRQKKGRRRKPAKAVSCHDLMKDLCGKYDGLPPDLSTNPKYMEGFGR